MVMTWMLIMLLTVTIDGVMFTKQTKIAEFTDHDDCIQSAELVREGMLEAYPDDEVPVLICEKKLTDTRDAL